MRHTLISEGGRRAGAVIIGALILAGGIAAVSKTDRTAPDRSAQAPEVGARGAPAPADDQNTAAAGVSADGTDSASAERTGTSPASAGEAVEKADTTPTSVSPGDAAKPPPGRPCNPTGYEGIYGAHPERERVARAEAVAWYSPRPVLGIDDPQESGHRETIYVQTCKGGRRGSPGDKISALRTVYAPAGVDPEAHSREVLIPGGAYELVQYEDDEEVRHLESIARPAKVRGHDGRAVKLSPTGQMPEVCMVSWAEKGGGKFRIYVLFALGDRCDDNSAVEFANRLTDLRSR